MSWRVAESLDQLLSEINASAPNRSKASDGSVGDQAHQSTDSDHNPHCQGWVVTARDFTHDPDGGFDSYAYADWQRRRCKGEILIGGERETRVSYIISNRRIASPSSNWAWCDYTGSNPHDHHVHVSVDCTGEGGAMDSTQPWGWTGGDDVAAQDVWAWDVDPSGSKRTAGGSLWDCLVRTDYLANSFAPATNNALSAMAADIIEIELALENTRTRLDSMTSSVADLSCTVQAQTDQLEDHGRTLGQIKATLVFLVVLIAVIGGGVGAWAIAAG